MANKKWPPMQEVEVSRWTNNGQQYHSIGYGFCHAQDSCENCALRIRLICKFRRWLDDIRVSIIKRHYGLKKGW